MRLAVNPSLRGAAVSSDKAAPDPVDHAYLQLGPEMTHGSSVLTYTPISRRQGRMYSGAAY